MKKKETDFQEGGAECHKENIEPPTKKRKSDIPKKKSVKTKLLAFSKKKKEAEIKKSQKKRSVSWLHYIALLMYELPGNHFITIGEGK